MNGELASVHGSCCGIIKLPGLAQTCGSPMQLPGWPIP